MSASADVGVQCSVVTHGILALFVAFDVDAQGNVGAGIAAIPHQQSARRHTGSRPMSMTLRVPGFRPDTGGIIGDILLRRVAGNRVSSGADQLLWHGHMDIVRRVSDIAGPRPHKLLGGWRVNRRRDG